MQAISLNLLGYIGPGGGISLLGPLFGVILAVLGAVFMIALWPLRLMIRRARGSCGSVGNKSADRSDQS